MLRSVAAGCAVLSLLFCTGLPAWAQCTQNCPPHRMISVTAEGTASTEADNALVHVGYQVFGPDAKSAYASATETSNAILQALLHAGVPKTAVESSSQTITATPTYEIQQYPMMSEERAQHRFTVEQGWTVHAKPDQAASLLDAAITAGANHSGWIEWRASNQNAIRAEASAMALANAHAVAEAMAQKLGVKLGQLISANENQEPFPQAGVMGGVMGSLGSGPGRNNPESLAITSRHVEIHLTVFASFSIE